MSTISLSRRARLDLAALVTAGVASSAFFLLAAWNTHHSAAPAIETPPLAATATLDPVFASAIRHVDVPHSSFATPPRAKAGAARTAKPDPALVRARAATKPAQSRLARFLLGDGRATVQPFPLR